MDIDTILTPERTFTAVNAGSKKRAIEFAATSICDVTPGLDVGAVYRGLLERERLGSTAIGEGVAIPHCRVTDCDRIIGGLFVLDEPVDFAAPDGLAISIMFVLLVPESEQSEHLNTLSMLAERLQSEIYRRSLLEARDSAALYDAAVQPLGDDQ